VQRDQKLLIRALLRQPTERAPVWLMRQAGRYLPEYRAVREKAGGFLEMIRAPELAAEVTLQPVRRFGMDAAILFSDILVPLEAMGMDLVFDERGPNLPHPIRTRADVDRLRVVEPRDHMDFVGEALRLTAAGLPRETALIGFCGAPFTLASYAVEGGTGKSFAALRKLMLREESTFAALMDKLAEMVARHLEYQLACGAEALVLFDTWASQLEREEYRNHAAPWARRALERVRGRVPCVAFAGASDHLLDELAELPAEGIALDHRSDVGRAFERFGARRALQGNLDPTVLLATPQEVAARTRALLEKVGGRPGHVLNLGHGVLKETPPECVGAFVQAAKDWRA
jgi:uroporphyrinogen decarboxylase